MYTQINIEELLNLFKEKGYHITTKRETDMTRLVYDGIIVGTFSPDLYTYNDYDVINVGSMVEIRGFQRFISTVTILKLLLGPLLILSLSTNPRPRTLRPKRILLFQRRCSP